VKGYRRQIPRVACVAAVALWAAVALVDRAAWPLVGVVALAAALAVGVLGRSVAERAERALLAGPRAVFVVLVAGAAAGVSWWWTHAGLRDMPLSIDASVYLAQARAMAHGQFGLRAPSPAIAFSDRFLLEGPDGRLYGVFPPGWPLALVPLVLVGAPMLAGPVLAALLVFAQASLGRALGAAGGLDARGAALATRASLLLALPSYARAMETADLLSHGFVALLATAALALALGEEASERRNGERERERGIEVAARFRLVSARRAVLLGVCVGWAIATRMLDGAVVAAVVAAVLVWRRTSLRSWALAAAGAAPLLAFLAWEQHVATGAWMLPTQSLYFQRSDWPPDCHRLGFGADVGCTIEHRDSPVILAGRGYGPREAFGVVHERAGALGEDLLGFAPLSLLVFAAAFLGASDAAVAAFVLVLTLAYGLFYYGNGAFYGARHLFPAAPVVWLLAARAAAGVPERARRLLPPAAALFALLATAAFCARGPWGRRGHDAASYQSTRSDLRRTLAAHEVPRAILKSRDAATVAAALDPWADGDDRLFVLDDGSGLVEVRRAHPDLPVLLSLPGDEIGTLYVAPPPDDALVELERAWPSFLRPSGLGARRVSRDGASGGAVLLLSHAHEGAELAVDLGLARQGRYAVRIDAVAGPDEGDWSLALDGAPLPVLHGYAAQPVPLRGEAVPLDLGAGRHTLVARCLGRDAASSGYDAELDALVGVHSP
jgi:hypothetical protein